MAYKGRDEDKARKWWRAYITSPKGREKHRLRVAARREAVKEGKVKTGDGNDVHHKKPISEGGGNTPGNTEVVPRKEHLGSQHRGKPKSTSRTRG